MATTTQSGSRAWEPEPDETVASGAPEADPESSDETAAADQAAMAAFAAAWSRGPDLDEPDADQIGTSEPRDRVPHQDRDRTRATLHQSGVPGRGVIVLSSAAAVLAVLSDFSLTGGLSIYFDLWFVVICLVGAMAVRRSDLFTAGVLAPLLFGALIALISLVAPATFTDRGGFGTVFPTGLTEHAGALVAGYGVALFVVACRLNARR